MSEAIWWRDEYWWEQKSIPLGPVTFSPRQLVTIVGAGIIGLVLSLPLNVPIAGIGFGGKAVALLVCVGVGYAVSRKRVKMVPVELQLFYRLRISGKAQAGKGKEDLVGKVVPHQENPPSRITETEMVIEDFKSLAPLSITGRAIVRKQSRLSLFVDGKERGDPVVISPDMADYRFVFVPGPSDIGTHEAAIMEQGSDKPVARLRIAIKKRGVEMLESKS